MHTRVHSFFIPFITPQIPSSSLPYFPCLKSALKAFYTILPILKVFRNFAAVKILNKIITFSLLNLIFSFLWFFKILNFLKFFWVCSKCFITFFYIINFKEITNFFESFSRLFTIFQSENSSTVSGEGCLNYLEPSRSAAHLWKFQVRKIQSVLLSFSIERLNIF